MRSGWMSFLDSASKGYAEEVNSKFPFLFIYISNQVLIPLVFLRVEFFVSL